MDHVGLMEHFPLWPIESKLPEKLKALTLIFQFNTSLTAVMQEAVMEEIIWQCTNLSKNLDTFHMILAYHTKLAPQKALKEIAKADLEISNAMHLIHAEPVIPSPHQEVNVLQSPNTQTQPFLNTEMFKE